MTAEVVGRERNHVLKGFEDPRIVFLDDRRDLGVDECDRMEDVCEASALGPHPAKSTARP